MIAILILLTKKLLQRNISTIPPYKKHMSLQNIIFI